MDFRIYTFLALLLFVKAQFGKLIKFDIPVHFSKNFVKHGS